MSRLKPGDIFANDYKLLRLLGSGGFSDVWLAHYTLAGNMEVAIKVYAPEKGLDSDGQNTFMKEYLLVYNLNHQHLLTAKHFGIYDGSPYLVMAYCKNGSSLKLTGRMNETQLAHFMQQAASALAYLHEQEPPIIHQDIKPDNFLLNDKGNYLLADFGISSQMRRTLTRSMGDKSSPGTMAFMPPEKWGKKKMVLPAGDIFSLGVSMYELLCGELPFGDMGGLAVHNGADIPDLPDGFPTGLNDILCACMAREPEQRPTAEQLYEAATAYLKTNKWPAMAITEIKHEPEHSQPENEKTPGRKTAEIPADKIPTPDNYKKDDTGGNSKPPFVDSETDNIPPAKHKRHWLRWLIYFAALGIIAGIIALIAINNGPGAEEMAAKAKAEADSLAAVQRNDSLNAVSHADSIAAIGTNAKPGSQAPATNTSTTSTSGFVFDYPVVWVAGGTFTMGCTGEQGSDCYDDEKPSHSVTVGSFNIGKYEVTQAQWKSVMDSNPSTFKGCDNCPVENVSWNDVQEFIKKLNSLTGKKYRLPKEAEWEFAARGGASTGSATANKYSGSDNVGSVAWYDGNSGSKTHPVGQKSPNELGIYDMSGNVWEWCSDWYKGYPGSSGVSDYTGSGRVDRGGGWFSGARYCRVSNRGYDDPGYRYYGLGFRMVCIQPVK